MYNNIGGKIKGLAKAIFIVQGISMAGLGIVLMCIDEDFILYGILSLALGPIMAWISSWILYGFGELIDKTCAIERNTRGEISETSNATMSAPEEVVQDITQANTIKKCDFCEKENVPGAHCKITDDFGVRYRDLCCNCIEENKKNISIVQK